MTQEPMKWKEAVSLLVKIAALDDPASLRLGDRLNLIEDLRRFLDIEGKGQPQRELERAAKQPDRLKPVIEAVRALVGAAADRKRIAFPFGGGKVVFDGAQLGKRDVLSWDGSLRDMMIQFAADDMAELEPGELVRCAACGLPFLAARKGQRYCCHACAVKVAVQRYQKLHSVERAQRERQRRQRKKQNPAMTTPEVSNGQASRQR